MKRHSVVGNELALKPDSTAFNLGMTTFLLKPWGELLVKAYISSSLCWG